MNYNCKRATELLSDSMHRKLTRVERIGLGLHMLICSACRRWRKQVQLMRDMMREAGRNSDTSGDPPMPDEMRERIAIALRQRAES